ncbi:spore coat U domain-containing protein [Immundisolibacter sp.]|uniref:Csu type fimbrial protein n=1 Tax=Immundisolibacter sp. TaxID=1934948 RepID=UPI00261993B3|nr:spore coat U domain-containing protein [Immundisolibacter sp.]MDD3651957.1 spore coat U domain-containing protein [Immundisolibacter sp.]
MHQRLLLALGLLAPPLVRAASCPVSATGIGFGSYDPRSGTPTEATGTVTVTCQSAAPPESGSYGIALGSGASGSYAGRAMMAAGGAVLYYQLYTDASHTAVWGDGSGGSAVVSGGYSLSDGTPRAYGHTVYGRIPAGQWPAAGSYTDTITVTVTY